MSSSSFHVDTVYDIWLAPVIQLSFLGPSFPTQLMVVLNWTTKSHLFCADSDEKFVQTRNRISNPLSDKKKGVVLDSHCTNANIFKKKPWSIFLARLIWSNARLARDAFASHKIGSTVLMLGLPCYSWWGEMMKTGFMFGWIMTVFCGAGAVIFLYLVPKTGFVLGLRVKGHSVAGVLEVWFWHSEWQNSGKGTGFPALSGENWRVKSNSCCGDAHVPDTHTTSTDFPACLLGSNPVPSEGVFGYEKTSSAVSLLCSFNTGWLSHSGVWCLIHGKTRMTLYNSFGCLIKRIDVLVLSSIIRFIRWLYNCLDWSNSHSRL